MRVRQYAYFGISSATLTPDAVTEAVGLWPDRTRLIGSRRPGPPPVPRFHLWDVRSGRPDAADLNDHFTALVGKLSGHVDRICRFLEDEDADGGIQVVRHFEAGPETEAIIERYREVDGRERLGGQHPLLSLNLEPEWLALALRLGGIDFDEYGDEYGVG